MIMILVAAKATDMGVGDTKLDAASWNCKTS